MSITRLTFSHDGTTPAGSLTTAFTMPTGCAVKGDGRFITEASCMPPSYFEKYWTENRGYYSPAICPVGYTGACARNTVGWMTGPAVGVGETATVCCPSGYGCAPSVDSNSFLYCRSTTSTWYSYANPVQVRWQAADLSLFETDPTRPGQTYTGVRTASSTGTASSSASTTRGSTPVTSSVTSAASSGSATASSLSSSSTTSAAAASSSSSGLSTGAQAGIGVGVALAGLAIFGLVLFFFLRRWHATRDAAALDSIAHADEKDAGLYNSGAAVHEAPVTPAAYGTDPVKSPHQLDSTPVSEMQGHEGPLPPRGPAHTAGPAELRG